jgi:uncharacterized membrane protein YeaQ/YmgE (transglycosylase-associated protein family)
MVLLVWIISGLIIGAIAEVLFPQRRLGTLLVGIVGASIGGGIAYELRLGMVPYQPGGWLLAALGAIALLTVDQVSLRTRAAV